MGIDPDQWNEPRQFGPGLEALRDQPAPAGWSN
jgi:hypothetical protein